MGKSVGYAKSSVNIELNMEQLFKIIDKFPRIELDSTREVTIELVDDETAILTIPTRDEVDVYFTPGRMYMSNGDPGYPDELDVEDRVDYQKLSSELTSAPVVVAGVDYDPEDDDDSIEYPEEDFYDGDY